MGDPVTGAMAVERVRQLNDILRGFKVKATCQNYEKIRNISLYDVRLEFGGKVRDIEKYSREIAMALKSHTVPIVKPITAKGIVRLEVVDEDPKAIHFEDRMDHLPMPVGVLPFYLGETIDGNPLWVDIHDAPHMLIAGATGSGKSTLLHTIVQNTYNFCQLNVFLMDTKQIEFNRYEGQTSIEVDYTYRDCLDRLMTIYDQMNNTYDSIRNGGDQANYYSSINCVDPYTLIVVDEFADLIMQDESDRLYEVVCKIAQKGRAAGIHMVIATQRPSVDIFRGTIKANFPTRIACRVSSRVDSQVVLDAPGANHLLGKGDALIRNHQYDCLRFQSAIVNQNERTNQYVSSTAPQHH